MSTIYHQVCINAAVSKVYEALAIPARIGTWWEQQTAVPTEQGLVLEHNPGPEHGTVRLRVVRLVPNQVVEWECISIHPSTSPASAWTGTRLLFELTPGGDSGPCASTGDEPTTIVDFRHVAYDRESKFYASNNYAWGILLGLLKKAVESRRSEPESVKQ